MASQPRLVPAKSSSSRALRVVASGYAVAALGLVALLTINGTTVPQAASAATIILIAVGLLLPSVAMLMMRRGLGKAQATARNGLLLQPSGLVILFLDVVIAVSLNSLSGFLVGTVLLAAAASLTILGAILFRKNHSLAGSPGTGAANYLMLGVALLFSGVGLIMASNIAFFYIISGTTNAVYTDMGAAISACGCVVAAYSFFETQG